MGFLPLFVIPAQAGIQQFKIIPRSGQNEPLAASFEGRPNQMLSRYAGLLNELDSRLRGNDDKVSGAQ